jgi:hypothetical protein
MGYNNKFLQWFSEKKGKKQRVLASDAREFVSEFIKAGKDTQILISALKYRFNECENRKFSFKGLNKKTENPKPHQAMNAEKLASIFLALENKPSIYLACNMLYDLAARSQDLLHFTFGSFLPTADGGASVTWIPKKTKNRRVSRAGLVTKKTFELLKIFQANRALTEPLFNMTEGTLLKQLSRAFADA